MLWSRHQHEFELIRHASHALFVDGNDDILLLEEVKLRRPFPHAFVTVLFAVNLISFCANLTPKNVVLLDMYFLIEERVEQMDLLRELRILIPKVTKQKPKRV